MASLQTVFIKKFIAEWGSYEELTFQWSVKFRDELHHVYMYVLLIIFLLAMNK